MDPRVKTFALFASLAGAIGGCSSSEVSATDLVTGTAAAICAKASECAATAPAGWEAFYGDTEAECRSTYAEVFGDVGASVDAGRVEFDAAIAGDCLDQAETGLADFTCEEFWGAGGPPLDAACDEIFTGTVALGGTCYSALDCAMGDCAPGEGDARYPGICE